MLELKKLYLSGMPVTDARLEHLKGLKKLEILGLHDVRISLTAEERLRAALPRMKIQGQPQRPDSPAPATAPAAGTGR